MAKKKKIIAIASVLGATYIVLDIIAKKKKADSVYENEPSQKNPVEGKKVIFVKDERCKENADGIRGYLEEIDDEPEIDDLYDKVIKPVIDKTLAFTGLVVLSPLLLTIAVAIKIEDPGPVLFTQKRVGKNKKFFKLHKFRSMKMCTPHDIPTHMLENPEQYITKVGGFLRAHSLDELPQIWDIFIGNMSIVGPRPALWNQDMLTALRDKYDANNITPGLTGWAQINGRDELELEDKADLDGEYVAKRGLKTDVKCFLSSIHVLKKDDSVVEGGTGELEKKMGRHYTQGKSDGEIIGDIGFNTPVIINHNKKVKVLVTGKDSYVGDSFINYAREHYGENLNITVIDMIDGSWRKKDFSEFDVVFHVAGIAHADINYIDEETREKYYKVNTDLAIEVANKCKTEGVKEFIFMSSMIVYGDSAPVGKKKIITKNTIPKPANFYGDSKLQADVGVRELADEKFKVVCLRPPMIYGKGSKGNYPILAKMAKILPVFPNIYNQRSMLYIDNLCEFLCKMILAEIDKQSIVLIPQNGEYTRTSDMVKRIGDVSGNRIILTRVFNPFVRIAARVPGKIGGIVNKAFGNNCYQFSISEYQGLDYMVNDLNESIEKTEGNKSGKTMYGNTDTKRVLMTASVASMIDLFNADNVYILQKLGYKVDVATNFEFGSITSRERVDEFRNELESRGIRTYHVPIPREISDIKNIVKSYRIMKKIVKNTNYDIIHTQSPIGGVVTRMACMDARKKGARVIYTAHGFHFYKGSDKKSWTVFYPVEKFFSRYTDLIITINHEDYRRAKQFNTCKVKYVPGIGVHTDRFEDIKINRIEKRAEFGFNDEDFVFMSTGQISARKNHKVIIEALAMIDNPHVKYLIVGFGELEDELKKKVNDLGLSDRVVFAGYRSDINELLGAADAFAFPSIQEGLPVSLMEAMASGLPIVCSKIRGNTDLIRNGEGGYLYNPNDVIGFANGMKKIISEYDGKMCEINRNTMKKFNNITVNKIMKKIYSE